MVGAVALAAVTILAPGCGRQRNVLDPVLTATSNSANRYRRIFLTASFQAGQQQELVKSGIQISLIGWG